MQFDRKYYDPEKHEIFKALSVKQPFADLLTRAVYRDEGGQIYAERSIAIRSRKIAYRGDLLICSSRVPVVAGHISGVTCGFVELYDVKPISEFTEQDWQDAGIPERKRAACTGYGWMFRNPRRVVEMPIKGHLGVYDFITLKGDLTEYPQRLKIGDDGWKIIQGKLKPKKK